MGSSSSRALLAHVQATSARWICRFAVAPAAQLEAESASAASVIRERERDWNCWRMPQLEEDIKRMRKFGHAQLGKLCTMAKKKLAEMRAVGDERFALAKSRFVWGRHGLASRGGGVASGRAHPRS
eukprot:15433572-Alexandrium_andersonii.AAC.2